MDGLRTVEDVVQERPTPREEHMQVTEVTHGDLLRVGPYVLRVDQIDFMVWQQNARYENVLNVKLRHSSNPLWLEEKWGQLLLAYLGLRFKDVGR